ncbi:SCO family protein [Thermocrinis sp.]|uniref:SCO family protein n=1 Tax=Thermocrinis sp. TaxID=2024383 RepID=UPI002FDE1C1E
MKLILLLLLPLLTMAYRISNHGEQDLSVVKIREELYLGKTIPDAKVKNLTGDVSLKEFINQKPTALIFAYYTCETACPLTVNNVRKLTKEKYRDYKFVVLSFDEKDNLQTLKAFVDKNFGGQVPENWLVGLLSKEDIKKLTEATGYKFYYIPRDRIFIHTSAIIFISPSGKITRYLYGAFPTEKDLKLAFIEAQKEQPRINNIIDLALLACYRYDNARSKYVIDPMLIFAGLGISGVLATFGLALLYKSRKEVLR